MSDALRQAVDTLDSASQIELLAALAERIASAAPPQIIGRELAVMVDDRARYPLSIPQWLTAAHQPRGVVIQALSFGDIEASEKAAMEKRKPDRSGDAVEYVINEFRQTIHEVCRGIVEPSGLTPSIVGRWNYETVAYIHRAIRRIGATPAALLDAELSRLAGGAAPPPTPAPDPHERKPPVDDMGGDVADEAAVPAGMADD